jgi:hypothetical protein
MVYWMRTDHHGRPEGTTTTRERPHDGGGAAREPPSSSEPAGSFQAFGDASPDGGAVAAADAWH